MQIQIEPDTKITESGPLSAVGPSKSRSRKLWTVATPALLLAGIVWFTVMPRLKARAALRTETVEMAAPAVAVVKPQPSAPGQEIVLPANVQPYSSAAIYSRTNGYLKSWSVDIGAHVKEGQLLAEVETPEVDQQLQQARATLATAEANLKLSQITANRYQELLKTHAVAQQDTDNAVGALAANQATVEADQATVRQLEQLVSFEKIYAPFDGVITARNTDVGDLISAGTIGGPTTALFSIAQPTKLRVYVNVPEAFSQVARPGLKADLVLAEFPGRRFPGTLVRTADAIDPSTRTLNVEISVNNPTGRLLAGSYAEVHLKVPGAAASYTLPVGTLLFRSDGLRVAVVQPDNHVALRTVTPGHDFGDRIEIIGGLHGDESVILNPPDSVVSGETVRVVPSPGAGGL